jgi:hypothetical protein
MEAGGGGGAPIAPGRAGMVGRTACWTGAESANGSNPTTCFMFGDEPPGPMGA